MTVETNKMCCNFALRCSSILLTLIAAGCSQEAAQEQKANAIPRVAVKGDRITQITDRNTDGVIESMRIAFKYDRSGRRLSNKVVDANENLLATEEFRYDNQGRLAQRQHLVGGRDLKWQWSNFDYNGEGLPTRNDIQNKKGKQIGWNVWSYKGGRLTRRDRFNSDGTLRFYFADIEYEGERYAKWSKFDATGKNTGTKAWRYDQ